MKHELWLWVWFTLGAGLYWLKRAYYLVTGPNPIANSYGQFLKKCWIPILVRWFLDSLVFWALFTPGFIDKALSKLGWTNASWATDMITQFAAFAGAFGYTVDSIMDFVLNKVPFIKDVFPQVPPPQAPTPAPVKPA